jgi:CubicO group peptidase (beta-lactamase class C family)
MDPNIILNASYITYTNGKTTVKNYKSTANTMYQIASCSKFITSLVVAKLYELKKLDYDTDINKYLKKWKCPKSGVTLRHLLTHTSGSSDDNGYLGMDPQIKYVQNLELNIKIITGGSYSKPFKITEKIGKKFMYSGAGFQVVQQVLEEITGKRLHQLMQQYIFTPLSMCNSTGKLLYEKKHKYKLADMDGLYRMYPETAAAGVWMSCNDLVKLGIDLINGYNYNTSKILKQDTIKLITQGEHPEWQSQYKNYGLGMFVGTHDGKKCFSHDGLNYKYKMHFHCVPETESIDVYTICYNAKYHNQKQKEIKLFLKS